MCSYHKIFNDIIFETNNMDRKLAASHEILIDNFLYKNLKGENLLPVNLFLFLKWLIEDISVWSLKTKVFDNLYIHFIYT